MIATPTPTPAASRVQARLQHRMQPGYPGIENGSDVVINGPQPGGPSPIPPYLVPHSLIVGEGSTPVKLLTFLNGQIPIGATGGDPAAANITGDGTATVPQGVAITNGANSITVSLNNSVQNWISGMQAWAQGMQSWADGVSAILDISPPSPTPPASGPT
jgi:hypothetical protein